jgi:26S proteasome regulatory subunit N5
MKFLKTFFASFI